MAVDQDKELDLEDLEIDLEEADPGQPRGDVLGEDDLEQYGVWVKVKPHAIDETLRPADSEPQLESLDQEPGSQDTVELTEEEEQLLGSLEEGSSDETPELEDLGDLSIPEEEELDAPELEAEQIEVTLSEEPTTEQGPGDLPALEAAALVPVEAAARSEVLQKIEEELSAIRGELTALKNELVNLRKPGLPIEVKSAEPEREAGFFSDDSDETIALTGDELDNILNTAEITEEEASAQAAVDELADVLEPAAHAGSEPEELEALSVDEPLDETPELETITFDEPLEESPALDVISLDEPLTEEPSLDSHQITLEIPEETAGEPEMDLSLDLPEETAGEPEMDLSLDLPEETASEPEMDLSLDLPEETAGELPVEATLEPVDEAAEQPMELELPDIDEIGLDSLEEQPEAVEEPVEELEIELTEELEAAETEAPPAVAAAILPEPDQAADEEELVLDVPEDVSADLEPLEAAAPEEITEEIALDMVEMELPNAEEELEELSLEIPDEEIAEAAAAAESPADVELLEEAEAVEELESGEQIAEIEELGAELPAPMAAAQPAPDARPAAMPAGLKDEMRTVLKYMDELLGALPDDKIEEFARSEYFEVYKRLFEELEIAG